MSWVCSPEEAIDTGARPLREDSPGSRNEKQENLAFDRIIGLC